MEQPKQLTIWTDEENKLVSERKTFTLAISFGDYQFVEKKLYEYDPMLVDVLNLSQEIIRDGQGHRIHELVKFDVEYQFVIAKNDGKTCISSVLGQYSSFCECEEEIKKDCNQNHHDYTEYVIVDLTNTRPCFFGKGLLGELSSLKYNEIGSFYDDKGILVVDN